MNSFRDRFSPEEIEAVSPWQWPEVAPGTPAAEDSGSDPQLGAFAATLERDLNGEVGESDRASAEPLPVVTAETLEAMQKQAFEEAARSGREAGYREGHDKGSQEGYREGYDKGFQQGYQEGKAKGEEEGRAQASQALADEVGYLDQLMAALAEPLAQVDEQVEQELATLAMTVAKHLVRRELKTDPGQIVAVVREALALLPLSQRRATLYMHPKDAELVRSALQLDQARVPWQIVEEPLIGRGGCRVETEVSRIDATVETRLAAVIAAALGGERSEDRKEQHESPPG